MLLVATVWTNLPMPAQENIAANAASFPAGGASVTAHCLDWTALPPVAQQHVGQRPAAGGQPAACALQQWAAAHGWSAADLRELLQAQACLALHCEHAIAA
jgi:hypothetical protein